MLKDDHYWDEFKGIDPPHYTQIADEIFNGLLPRLGHAELKVLLLIARKTFGWNKDYDAISLSQLQEGTQLGITSIKRAVKSLESKGVIWVHRMRARRGNAAINTYGLVIKGGRAKTGLPQAQNGPHKKQLVQETNDNETASLSLALEISEAHSNGPRDRKALTTSLSKFPVTVLEKVGEQLDQRVAKGGVENPAAYANRLAQVFAEAEAEAQVIREKEQQNVFDTILSTAVFEHSDGQTPADLRESLLQYWPGEQALIQRAVELVST